MADTAVAITAGSGTNIDTRTEATNGNHRQVVVLGDPSTNAGVAPVDATNGLSVNVTNASLTVASHAVTNAGTFAVQESGSALTALQLIDDNMVAQGTALGTTKNALVGGSVTTSAPTYTTGQISPLSLDTTGALRVTGAGGGTQYTEDVAAATDPVGNMMVAVRRDTLSTSEVSADGDNIALKATNKGKLHVAAELRVADTVIDTGVGTGGSATPRMAIDTSQLPLAVAHDADATSSPPALVGGYASAAAPTDVSADGDSVRAWFLRNGSQVVTLNGGMVAHDAADANNPLKIGGKAKSTLSGVTLVAADDRTDGMFALDGAQFVRTVPLGDVVSGSNSNTDGTSTEVIAAAGAGIKQYLTHVSLSNTHASSSVMVALKSGTTSRWRVNVPPGGREVKFDPPLAPNAANEAWNFDPDSAVTTIECSMNGFKSKI